MNCFFTVLAACLALASAGYVEHYQGATSFTSFDLKSAPIVGSKLVIPSQYTVKGSTDHALARYEAKPVISAVYGAPITKTLTYSSAPVQHVAPAVQLHDCALKEHTKLITPVQTSASYGGSSAISASSSGSWSQSGYSGAGYQQTLKAPGNTYGGSSTIGHTVTHHYSAPQSTSIIYTPPKSALTVESPSYGAYGNQQQASFGTYKELIQPAPIIETLVDVAPPKQSVSYGAPAAALHLAQPQKTVTTSSSNYATTGSSWKQSNAGYATSHQYKAATIPAKPSRFYIAPALQTSIASSAGSGWQEASKNHGHSFTTTHNYNTQQGSSSQQYLPPKAPASIATVSSQGTSSSSQQYLPPKTPATVSSQSSSKDTTTSSPPQEYLPPREYLPPSTASYGAHQGVQTSTQQLQSQSFGSSSSTSNHGSAQYAAVLSPLHVTIQKTPILAYTPKLPCETQDHQHLHQ